MHIFIFSKRHNQNNLWNFLKINYNKNPKIIVDKYLDKLEELDLNKKKYIFS